MQQSGNKVRQGIGYGSVQTLGVAIGAISTIWLYGHVLEVYGAVQFFLSAAALLFPIASLGVYALNYHFFPIFENKDKGHHGFLPLLLMWSIGGTFLCLLAGGLCWPLIQPFAALQNNVISSCFWLIGPILLFTVLNFTLAHYAANFGRITIPALLNDLFLKLAVPALMLMYLGHWLDVEGVLFALTGYLAVTTIALLFYVRPLGQWRWFPDQQIMTPSTTSEMVRYAGYNTITGLGVSVLARLDLVILGLLLNPESVGAYSVAVTIAGVIEIPFKTASTMSAPVISKHLHWYNYKKLEQFLKNSANYTFLLALVIAGGIWLCSADIFDLMPQKKLLDQARIALLLLVIVKIADASMGLNGYVLMLSRYYRYHFGVVFAVLCIHLVLLLMLIPQYGLIGAAMSTLLSSLIFNGLATFIVYFKIGVHSFSDKMLHCFLVMSASGAITYLLTFVFQTDFFILLLKGIIYLVIFFGLTFAFHLIPESKPWRKLKNQPSFKSSK